jgi:hypothetical protein
MHENVIKMYLVGLRPVGIEKAHKFVARILSIYLTHEWFVYGLRSDVLNPYTVKLVLTVMPRAFFLFVIGLWLSTTDFGKRHKKTTYILLLPSLLMSPSIAGFPYKSMGWLSFFVAIWSYVTTYRSEVRT